jgi:hypothetical protein
VTVHITDRSALGARPIRRARKQPRPFWDVMSPSCRHGAPKTNQIETATQTAIPVYGIARRIGIPPFTQSKADAANIVGPPFPSTRWRALGCIRTRSGERSAGAKQATGNGWRLTPEGWSGSEISTDPQGRHDLLLVMDRQIEATVGTIQRRLFRAARPQSVLARAALAP